MSPFPNEHSCRLEDPGQFERFARMTRRHGSKAYSAIIGFLKGGGSKTQALRYPKDTWTAAEARAHCQDNGGSFEAARAQEMTDAEIADPKENPFLPTGEEE